MALTNMLRWVLCVLALFVAGGLSYPAANQTPVVGDKVILQRQLELMTLFFHIHECKIQWSWPGVTLTEHSDTWSIEENIHQFSDMDAVKTYYKMLKNGWTLPRYVPFDVHQPEHKFEAATLFKVLYTAKSYLIFYNTAHYLKERINEHLFSYVLSAVILNRKDTQGYFIPHLYEVFPSFFNNGEIMTTAQRINTHGFHNIDCYSSTYKWDDNVVIRWNATTWPYAYYNSEAVLAYFTHDYVLNTVNYNMHVSQSSWLGDDLEPLVKDRRGEFFWFYHKQLLTRYYMERLSNGLGEIPEIGGKAVQDGYTSGLLYHNGIPFPVRPNHFPLDQPDLVDDIQEINDYESRVRDAIDKGFVTSRTGEHIDLRAPKAIEVLGRVIEASVDSPNVNYYKDFISVWMKVLGNSLVHEHQHYHHYIPLVVPSVLEHYQTALRDPAFYMVWKRVLGLFERWQKQLPLYKHEELAVPEVSIEKVDVDKMVSYFENNYMNISNHLHTTDGTSKHSVLVEHPRLNHKAFNIRVHVNSKSAKKVYVKFFLAPKYDSHNYEIPLHINSQNAFFFDLFDYDLPAGKSVITRSSTENLNFARDWTSTYEEYEKVLEELRNGSRTVTIMYSDIEMLKMPQRLILPKGRVGGMSFILLVYISEGFNSPLGFPFNRPIYTWQVKNLTNLYLQDVLIHHKHTPEIGIPHSE